MAVAAYADFSDAPHLPGTININIGPFEDGAKIASYAPFADEEFDPYVHMDPLLTFGIVFGQGSATAGLDCGVALRWMRSHIVNRVLPPLAPYLA
jgi:hypothetical protein